MSPCRADNRSALEELGIPYATIRLSVGLEPVEVLIDDLSSALASSSV